MDRVAYRPLETNIAHEGLDDDLDINSAEIDHLSEADGTEQDESKVSLTDPREFKKFKKFDDCPYPRSRWGSLIGFRNLRFLLYFMSIILMFIFTVQLISTRNIANRVNLNFASNHKLNRNTHDDTQVTVNHSIPHDSQEKPNNSGEQQVSNKSENKDESNKSVIYPLEGNSPQFSHNNSPAPDLLDDDFIYPHPGHTAFSNRAIKSNHWWSISMRNESMYIAVSNYIRGKKVYGKEESVTLTTQATVDFMHHAIELCKRWDGPISIAVFCPGPELKVAVTLIKFLRQCLPAPLSACISEKITWHLAYNRQHGPNPSEIGYPKSLLDKEHYPLFTDQDMCPKLAGPEPNDLVRQFEAKLMNANKLSSNNYRQQLHLPYPINVLRNVARETAKTKYLMASDIELYPSMNLVPMFVDFMMKHNLRKQYNYMDRFIFTLPIFEVKSNVSVPKTKDELVELLDRGDAIFFHKWVCDACQNFPGRSEWLRMDTKLVGDSMRTSSSNELKLFEITQRDNKRDQWEPIFIGTQEDPPYDERLSWDGRRDKMGLMVEMCLRDYYLIVLGNAFLVHAPGIKRMADRNDIMKRYSYIKYNNAIYDATMERLKREYSSSSNSNKCLIK